MPKPEPKEPEVSGRSPVTGAAEDRARQGGTGSPPAPGDGHLDGGTQALRESQQQLIKSNAALIALNQKLEEATMAQSECLANVCREIRTPMDEILGLSTNLLGTQLTLPQRESLGAARNRAEALLPLIDDVVDFSSIQSGHFSLEPHPFELHACIEDVFDSLARQAAEKDIELAYFVVDAIPPVLVCDAARLRQILLNLCRRAIGTGRQGELSIEVVGASRAARDRQPRPPEAFASPDQWEMGFAVHRSGHGIPVDFAQRLFRFLEIADSSSLQPRDAAELRLVLSRRLVELLGGKLSAHSNPDRSVTFRFTVAAHAAPTATPPAAREFHERLAGKQLLVAASSAALCRMVAEFSSRWGVKTTAAFTATETLGILKQTTAFDAALIDLRLTDQDGLSLAEAIRVQFTEDHLPIILLSGARFPSEVPLPPSSGISEVVSKPIRSAQLLEALLRALSEPPALPVSAPGEAPVASRGRPPSLKLLLADDNPINQKVGLSVLQKLGFRADLARNGLEVLQALEDRPYDIVFLDVQMPELDGLETARRICRRWLPGQRPRLVAMTGNAMAGDRQNCLSAGMDDYISKPFRVSDLRKALQRWAPQGALPDCPSGDGAKADPPPDLLDVPLLEELRRMPASEGVSMLQELADLFVETVPQRLLEIAQAVERPEALVFHAQALKSMSQDLGAKRMIQLAERIEDLGRRGRGQDTAGLLRELETAFAQTRDQLLAFRPPNQGVPQPVDPQSPPLGD